MVAFAGLAEEDRFDAAAGTKRFFDEADAFDANGAGFRGKTAAERHAEFFEPAIVAAGEDSGRGCARCGASGFAGGGHQGERSKFRAREVSGPRLKAARVHDKSRSNRSAGSKYAARTKRKRQGFVNHEKRCGHEFRRVARRSGGGRRDHRCARW